MSKDPRNSIFRPAFRFFFKTLSAILALFIGGLIFIFLVNMLLKPSMQSDTTTMLIAPDAEGGTAALASTTPVILRLNIHGVIGSRDLNAKTIETQLIGSQGRSIRQGRVRGVLLHIDSPGGTVLDSFNIYRSLIDYKQRYQVPIYAFADGLCASGAMMIACAADVILANPVAVVGSVGVRSGPYFNVSDLMARYGVSQITLTEGKNKDALNPFRPWREDEAQSRRELMTYSYNLFVDLMTQHRPHLSRKRLVQDYGAQIFDAAQAQRFGYVDEANSSYASALRALTQKADLDETAPYQVLALKVMRPVLSNLIEGGGRLLAGKVVHELSLPPELDLYLSRQLLYLYEPAALSGG